MCVCVLLCYKMSMLLILTTQFLLGTAIQAVRGIVLCVLMSKESQKGDIQLPWGLELNLSFLIWGWVQGALKPLRKTFTRR